ncbi:MAG: hypothetical protein RMK60_06655 [Burkholderiales bacterium]|nr:hypothetical protein [Burkholderiales bacterium]
MADTRARLYIGHIEVVVVRPASSPVAGPSVREDAFLSRHYLRRL